MCVKNTVSRYHMEQKPFFEGSCINDNTWENVFAAATFKGLWDPFCETE